LELITPAASDDVRAVYHLYVVRVPHGRRQKVAEQLSANGISTGIHYPIALPFLEAYRHLGHTARDFPESLNASSEILSLPMFPEMTSEQVAYVAEHIRRASV
jgi:dTDP-4-amino-4,6-dideoxygalactose transaminase